MSTYQYITGGVFSAPILQSTLPRSAVGEENIITFSQALPNALAAMLTKGDIPALIGCKDQRGELIKVKKGSYNSTTRNARIIRGVSRWSNNALEDKTIDFQQPNTILLDFSLILPYNLQDLYDRVGVLEGQDDLFFNTKLPAGTTDQKGTYKSAYRPVGLLSNEAQRVVTTDAPAHEELYKAIYGGISNSYNTLTVNTNELVRIGVLRELLDYLAFAPARLTALKKIIDKEIANPT
jgi:hypothetical protein